MHNTTNYTPMKVKLPKPKIFACEESKELAKEIAKSYGQKLGKSKKIVFSDGEFQVSFEESLRGRRVFIICSTVPPTDNLMELLLMIDAAKRASARHITAVIPYFGWARQDRKDKPRVPIAAKLVANISNVKLISTPTQPKADINLTVWGVRP